MGSLVSIALIMLSISSAVTRAPVTLSVPNTMTFEHSLPDKDPVFHINIF